MDADDYQDWKENMGEIMAKIGRMHMPFGKYGPASYPPFGMPLYDLPAEYLMWFRQKGFPKGKLGSLLEIICEVHMSGAEAIFEPLRRAAGGRRPIRKPRQRDFEFPEE